MSTPSPPYYYKDDSDTYHWEKCSNNHYPATGWHKSDKLPASKTDQCNLCKIK